MWPAGPACPPPASAATARRARRPGRPPSRSRPGRRPPRGARSGVVVHAATIAAWVPSRRCRNPSRGPRRRQGGTVVPGRCPRPDGMIRALWRSSGCRRPGRTRRGRAAERRAHRRGVDRQPERRVIRGHDSSSLGRARPGTPIRNRPHRRRPAVTAALPPRPTQQPRRRRIPAVDSFRTWAPGLVAWVGTMADQRPPARCRTPTSRRPPPDPRSCRAGRRVGWERSEQPPECRHNTRSVPAPVHGDLLPERRQQRDVLVEEPIPGVLPRLVGEPHRRPAWSRPMPQSTEYSRVLPDWRAPSPSPTGNEPPPVHLEQTLAT
jgi:hypothetical protein